MNDQEESGKSTVGALATIVEYPGTPEVYADAAVFLASKGDHNISISFGSFRYDNPATPTALKNVIILRLVIPAVGAIDLVNDLQKNLRDRGLMPKESGAN
jgi:hypothetical protein